MHDDTDEVVDYGALHRLWPPGSRYGQPGTWFAWVGRTKRQRDGMTTRKVDRGSRGCRWGDPDGARNEIAGEVTCG